MRSSAAVPTWLLAAARRALGRHPPLLLVLTALVTAAVFVHAQEHNPVLTRPPAADAPTQRLIVKLRGTTQRVSAQASNERESLSVSEHTSRVAALASRLHYAVDSSRALGGDLYAIDLSPLEGSETQAQTLALLSADEEVEFAVPDRRVYAHAVPNDPIANLAPNGQWYLRNVEPSAINANAAWDITRGSNGVVIAFADTGVRFEHPDIQRTDRGGRLLAGYDFVSADRGDTFITANDEDGRDLDAADPGDYCGQGSSWHGTRVAGILGALTNNGIGVAGVTWNSYLLPIRVLGRCGGYTSDVLAGLRWAAGLEVPGVLPTPTPAQIINVSLGARGACDPASAETIAEITAAGVLVVVAAGNEGREVESPANCPGSLAVAGLRHSGTKVGFSSLGPEVALGAPAGNCVNTGPNVPCVYTIDTTINLGLNVPTTDDYTNDLRPNTGTSFSAPIVSGIAGLMLAANGNLRSRQLYDRLRSGAKPFPAASGVPICHVPAGDVQGLECACTQETCGAGMANAVNSVNEALRPIAAISVPATFSPGETITLAGGGSGASCNAAIAGYAWSVVSGPATLTNANAANASLQAPAAEAVRVRLTVTDNAGRTDSTHVTVNPTSAAADGPSNAGSTACLAPRSPPPFVTLTATDNAAEEGAAGDTGTFTATRSGSTTNAITVGIEYLGTASVGTDYQALPSSVSFAAGATSTTLTVVPLDDDAGEIPETLTASLQMGSGYSVASQSKATVAMNDDDFQEITVFAQDSFTQEENVDTGSFVVNRSGNTSRSLTVGLSYAGTATSGSDYQAMPASVTFAVGSKSTSIALTPIDDALPDNSETVTVTIEPAASYVVHPGNGRAMISIRDSETPQMGIVASDGTASEQGPDGGAFVVRRTGPNGTPVTVNIETVGTATPGVDYPAMPVTVSMEAGQSEVSFTITPVDDSVAEEQESVIASLAVGVGYDLGVNASAIVRITDNDGAPQQAPGTTSSSSRNGGGGVLDLLTLLAVLAFAVRAAQRPSIAGRLRIRGIRR
jgi:serine protease